MGLNSNCTYNFGNKIGFNCPNLLDAKLCLSTNGFVNVVAKVEGTQVMPIDFDPGAGEALVGVNGTNGRIVKVSYSSSGEFIDVKIIIDNWAVRINNFSVESDLNQNFYFTGTFGGTVDFDPSNNTTNLIAKYFLSAGIPTSGKDLFFTKYDNGCNLVYCQQVGNYQSESANDIYIKSNYCLITGQFDLHYSPTNISTSFPVDFNFDDITTSNLMPPPRAFALKISLCPNVSFVSAGNNQTICQGETLTLAANGATTYSWNNGVVNNIAFTPTASNSYIVNGTDVNGCQDSDTVIVTVNSNSSSQLTQTATGTYTLNGQTYSQSGTYTQVIPNANGCDSTITLNLTINGAGINEVSTTVFNIYPNPAKNQFNIDFDGQINKLEIIDAKGAQVYTTTKSKEEYTLPTYIEVGYYLVVIHTDTGIFRKELLIEK
jgi:hypothetical protein